MAFFNGFVGICSKQILHIHFQCVSGELLSASWEISLLRAGYSVDEGLATVLGSRPRLCGAVLIGPAHLRVASSSIPIVRLVNLGRPFGCVAGGIVDEPRLVNLRRPIP